MTRAISLLSFLNLLLVNLLNGQSITTPGGVTSYCQGSALLLTATPTPVTTYSWEKSTDGNNPWQVVGTNIPTYSAISPGFYRISVSGPPPTFYTAIQITENPKPIPSFTFSPTGQCGSVPVLFTNTTTGAVSYLWNFGDSPSGANNTSNVNTPLHRFVGTAGNGNQNFTVTQTATSAQGCVAIATNVVNTKQLPSTLLGGPNASIYDNKKYFKVCSNASNANLNFNNQSTTLPTNSNYQIIWGNGNPDYNANNFDGLPNQISQTYPSGTTPLLYIVTGQNACIDTGFYNVFVGNNPAVSLGNPGNTEICTSSILTFPITNTATNSPVTVYTVTFNDGTPPVNFPHPPPADISHTFLLSSCGYIGGNYSNSFSATIIASNPCLSSTIEVVPIYVSKKGNADFTLAPKDTVCVNTIVSFTNTTGSNSDISSGTCAPGKSVWKITPSTGWSVSSGSLGNDFGLSDASLWTNGSGILSINFTTPGNYIIKLKTGNTKCGNDSITRTICVTSTPLANFEVDNLTGCTPLTVSTTNNSNPPFCGTNKYLWSVSYLPTNGCTPSTSLFNYLNGTNASSVTPQFQFINPGTYTINLLTIIPGAICTSAVATKTIIVKAKPVVNIANILPACPNASIIPLATSTCYINGSSTYLWTFTGGTPSTSNAATPGSIIFSTSGTYNISLDVTNECGTTNASQLITIKQQPDFNAPSNISYCAGETTSVYNFVSIPSGATFTWTNSNNSIGLAASGNNNLPSFIANNNTLLPLTATVNVTASLNGCSRTKSFLIIVNPRPQAPVVTTPIAYCQNETASALTATASAGNTLLWYATGTGGVGSANAPLPNTAIIGNSSYFVSQISTSFVCESPRVQINVNVNAIPIISNLNSVQPSACGVSNGSISFSVPLPSSVYTVKYLKNGILFTLSLTSSISSIITISNLGTGTYSDIFVVKNGCSSSFLGPVILSNPNPPSTPTIANVNPICSGTTLSLVASTATSGATFSWSGPNSFTSSLSNPNITNTSTLNSGTYSVIALVNGCASTAATVDVIIDQTPAIQTVFNNGPLCAGNTINFNASSNIPNVTYTWAGVGGFTSSLQNPSILNSTVAMSGTYSVSAISTTNAQTCTSAPVNTVLLIKPVPKITDSSAISPAACASATGSILLNGLAANTNYIINYSYNNIAQAPLNLVSSLSGLVVINSLVAGTYSNITATLNGCVSNVAGPFTLLAPSAPNAPTVFSNSPLCSGNTLNLTASSSTPGASFSWSGPSSFVSNIANPSITNCNVANAGVYSVVAAVAGCSSAPVQLNVIINQTPFQPTITSNSPICNNSNIFLTSTTTTPGATTISWIGPNGFTSTAQNPSILNASLLASGQYTVTFTSVQGLCTSQTASTMVVVNPTPNITSSSFTNPTACASATGSVTLNGLAANTLYNVQYNNQLNATVNASLTSNSIGSIIISGLLAGTYSAFNVSILGCTSNFVGPFVLTNPTPPNTPLASNNGALCIGNNLQLNASTTSIGVVNYAWSGPNGFSSSLQNPTINNITAANAGQYNVVVTINNCASSAGTTILVVNPLPSLPSVTTPVNYCIGTPTTSLIANASPGNTLNWYNSLSGGLALTSAPTPSSVLSGSTNYYVSQTTTLGCEGARGSINVIINPNAKALFTPTEIINCAPFNLTTSIVGLQQFPLNNSIYEWYANNSLIGTGINFPGYTILNQNDSVIIKLKTISLFGCKNDSSTIKFFTYKIPNPSFTLSDTVGCGPLAVNFVNTSEDINLYSYSWNFGNGSTSTLVQPGMVIFNPNPTFGDTTYLIKLNVSSVCNSIIFQKSIRIKSKPKALFTADRTSGCSPMRVLFTNTSKGLNNTYYWDFGDGSPTYITTLRTGFNHIFYTGAVTNYNVRLIAENDCGRDTIVYTLTVAPNNIQLLYSINGPETYGCTPHTVAFYNNSNGASSFQWDFGDGNTLSTTQNIQTIFHTYLTAGNYTVTLTAANNCTDTFAIKQITVYPKPTASFSTNVSNACIGQIIQTNNISSSATSYLWDFGDNTASSNLFNPIHIYSAAGTYTIRLIIYRLNPSGNICTDTTTRLIHITSALEGNFTQTATSGNCAPLTVTFVNLIRPSVTAVWNFGDGNTASGDSVVHTYLTAGLYNVSLAVTVAGGCTYNKISTVNLQGPSGTLQYTHGYICFPNAATFTALANNTNNYVWNFGDGITQNSTLNIITHNYSNPGIYIPSVTLQNNGGCNIPVFGFDTIKVDKIINGFKSVQSNNCGNTIVNFTDTSYAYFGKALVKWRFGDGSTGIGSNINHAYLASGSYNVEMIVIGNSGCTDTTKKVVTVLVNNNPIASIIAPTTKCVNDSVLFQSNVISSDLLNPNQWKIMPNGTTFNGSNFTYLFNSPGNYTIRLIAGTVNGCYDTVFHTISINNIPIINATASLNICKGNSTQLNASGGLNYQWSPINGLSCNTCPNPIASPLATTPYIVTAVNSFGCSNFKTVTITVTQPTSITVSPDVKICIGQSTNLIAVGASNYLWDNAQTLTNPNIANPTASPTVTTNYRVIGFDNFNCFADTGFVQVGVGQYPTINLGSDKTLPTGTLLPLNSIITNGPVSQWLWSPSTELSCNNCSLPIATIKKDITYTVKITTAYGCSANDTLSIKTFCESAQVFIPKAFTPDNDGLNDILIVRGTGIISVKYFRIFNRWGELVFEKNNFPPNNQNFGWDGKIKGITGPPDVFVYTAEVVCENGSTYTYKGNTTIIK